MNFFTLNKSKKLIQYIPYLNVKKIMHDNFTLLGKSMMDITSPLPDSADKKIAPLHGSKETLL